MQIQFNFHLHAIRWRLQQQLQQPQGGLMSERQLVVKF